MKYNYEKFEDWFDEIESYSPRSMRAHESIEPVDKHQWLEVQKWLRAAFESGRESNK